MKQTNNRENTKQPEERDIAITQGTTSTDFTKANKAKFLQTISSNFSHQSNQNQKNIKSKIISRNNNLLNQQSKTNDKLFILDFSFLFIFINKFGKFFRLLINNN